MCGRYNVIPNAESWLDLFDLAYGSRSSVAALPPRYNLAPTQQAPVVRKGVDGRELDMLHWGLIPHWTKPALRPRSFINARAETVAERPAFRDAFRRRPCLVPANGWYEWRKHPEGGKQPYCIVTGAGDPMAFAGLWETWTSPEHTLVSFTILTVEARDGLYDIHPRMPLVLAPSLYEPWLSAGPEGRSRVVEDAALSPEPALHAYSVSTIVNNPRHDTVACLERCGDQS